MIIEIAGRPAGHVKKSLEEYVMTLNDIKDIEVHSIKVSSPKKIEDSVTKEKPAKKGNEMFTCFAEIDFETETFARLSEIMFDFMPSSIEVVEPSNFKLSAPDATNLLNNISGRLHRYDEIAKIAHEKIRYQSSQLQLAQKMIEEKSTKKKPLKKRVKKMSTKKKK